jgi:Flp pilus assembly protein TadG
MAFVLPLLISLIFAVMEIGRFWGARHGIANAAREGARVLVTPPDAEGYGNSDEAVREAALTATRDYLRDSGLADLPPVVEITPVWLDHVDGIYGNGDDQIQTSFSQPLTRGDRVGIRIVYKFDTPLPVLLAHGQSPLIIKIECLLDHE